jgi:MscS family membrane protein
VFIRVDLWFLFPSLSVCSAVSFFCECNRLSDPAWTTAELDLRRLWETYSAWNWLALLAAVAVGLVAGRVAVFMLSRLARRFDGRGWLALQQMMVGLMGPANLALLTAGLYVGLQQNGSLTTFTRALVRLLATLAVSWYVYNLTGLVDLLFRHLPTRRESLLDRQLAPMVRKSLRTVVVVLTALLVAQNVFGQPVGTWLAGLGLAGLAVSLAAQDSLKNFFGSITILLDRPFQVGDRIVFGGYDGQIDEIGFRSTKLRTAAGHLITIPNSKIVSDPVENISRRPYIRRSFSVALAAGTPSPKLQQAITILRGVLAEPDLRKPIHAVLEGESYPPRVYLSELQDGKPTLTVTYWYAPPDYWPYAEHAEQVNLRIYQALAAADLSFALPSPPAPVPPPASVKPGDD